MTMKDSTYLSHLVRRIKWSDIDEKYVAELVKTARAEDIEGAGLAVLPKVAADITTRSLTPSIKTSAALCARRVKSLKKPPTTLSANLHPSQKTATKFQRGLNSE